MKTKYNKKGACRKCGMHGDLCICDDLKKADKKMRRMNKNEKQ